MLEDDRHGAQAFGYVVDSKLHDFWVLDVAVALQRSHKISVIERLVRRGVGLEWDGSRLSIKVAFTAFEPFPPAQLVKDIAYLVEQSARLIPDEVAHLKFLRAAARHGQIKVLLGHVV